VLLVILAIWELFTFNGLYAFYFVISNKAYKILSKTSTEDIISYISAFGGYFVLMELFSIIMWRTVKYYAYKEQTTVFY
jgi:membrane protein CcdC involved in cytochrome C biogenesis